MTRPSPVFILGAPRSGTSIISEVLRNVLGYAGENEGHLWTVFERLDKVVEEQGEFVASTFPPKAVTTFRRISSERLSEDLTNLFRGYVSDLYGDSPWCDKTPGPELIRIAPKLQEIFPETRFLYIKRRGIENVMSSQRKFPDRDFKWSCQYWHWCAEAFLNVQNELDHLLILDHQTLVCDPEGVCEQLGGFLGLEPDEVRACAAHIRVSFPERTHPGSEMYRDLHATGWSREEKGIFMDICKAGMDAMGYQLYAFGTAGTYDIENENEWCEPTPDPFANGFVLHPNPPGDPSPRLRYHSLNLAGTACLQTQAACNPEGAGAVLRIGLQKDGKILSEESYEIPPGDVVDVELTVPKESSFCDLFLSAELKPDSETHHFTGVRIGPLRYQ